MDERRNVKDRKATPLVVNKINSSKSEKTSKDICWFDVEVNLKDKILSSKIVVRDISKRNDCLYYFYLIQNGEILERNGWANNPEMSWELNESGVYCVQGYIKYKGQKTLRKSIPVGFVRKEDAQEYESFLKNDIAYEEYLKNELKFYPVQPPFADFIFYTTKNYNNAYDSFCKNTPAFHLVHESKIGGLHFYAISTNEEKYLKNDEILLYSGTTIFEKKYIIGVNDLPNNIIFENLNAGTGWNTCVSITKEKVKFGRDYLGMARYFVYESDDVFVISNRYHALLLLLRELGIKLKLDIEKALLTLSTVSIPLLAQNFSYKMDLVGIRQLKPHETYILDDEGWHKQDTECGNDIKYFADMDKEEYKNKLKIAATEIKNNLEVVIKDSRFAEISLDLTGGLDSRIVFAALTNLRREDIKEKVKIYTKDISGSKDLEVAAMLNAIYEFAYDDFGCIRDITFLKDMDQVTRSFYLGIHFGYKIPTGSIHAPNQIKITGACGEIIGRPYMVRKYLGTMIENAKDIQEFTNYIWSDFSTNICAANEKSSKIFTQFVQEEIESSPMKNWFEAYDYIYHCYRCSYHFDPTLRFSFAGNEWTPLLSKTAFQLFRRTFNQFKDINHQLDLIGMLNPLLLNIPFDNVDDEEARNYLMNELVSLDNRFKDITLDIDKNMYNAWEQANIKKKKNTLQKQITEKKKQIAEYELKNRDKLIYNELLLYFRQLMLKCPQISGEIGAMLYSYILKQGSDPQKVEYMYHKVRSLVDQLEFTQ